MRSLRARAHGNCRRRGGSVRGRIPARAGARKCRRRRHLLHGRIPARAGASLGDNVRVKHNDIVSDMLRQARESHPEFSKMEMLRFEVEFRAEFGGKSYYVKKAAIAKREQTKPKAR